MAASFYAEQVMSPIARAKAALAPGIRGIADVKQHSLIVSAPLLAPIMTSPLKSQSTEGDLKIGGDAARRRKSIVQERWAARRVASANRATCISHEGHSFALISFFQTDYEGAALLGERSVFARAVKSSAATRADPRSGWPASLASNVRERHRPLCHR